MSKRTSQGTYSVFETNPSSQNIMSDKENYHKEIKLWQKKLLISSIFSAPLFVFILYDFIPELPFRHDFAPYIGIISLILSFLVILFGGNSFYREFWSSLKVRNFSVDSLIVVGTFIVFIYSVYELVLYFLQTGSLIGLNGLKINNLYFEISAFLIVFVTLNKWLKTKTRGLTGKIIWLPRIIILVLVLIFITIFYQFIRISTENNINAYYSGFDQAFVKLDVSAFLTQTPLKIGFIDAGSPKLFLAADALPERLKFKQSQSVVSDTPYVYLGSIEGQMIKNEGFKVGDQLTNFFGLPKIRIAGILAPTNTPLDYFYIVNSQTFFKLQADDKSLQAKLNSQSEINLLYYFDQDNLSSRLSSITNLNQAIYKKGDSDYLPLFLGFDTAFDLRQANLYKNNLDTIDNLSGHKVIIINTFPKTYTPFDSLYFIPQKYGNL